MSSDEEAIPLEGAVADTPKAARPWKRGNHMTPQKRASQFPGILEVRGDSMWCGSLPLDCQMGEQSCGLPMWHQQATNEQLWKSKVLLSDLGLSTTNQHFAMRHFFLHWVDWTSRWQSKGKDVIGGRGASIERPMESTIFHHPFKTGQLFQSTNKHE